MTDRTIRLGNTIFNLSTIRELLFSCQAKHNCSMKVVTKEPSHDTHQYFGCSNKKECNKFITVLAVVTKYLAKQKTKGEAYAAIKFFKSNKKGNKEQSLQPLRDTFLYFLIVYVFFKIENA